VVYYGLQLDISWPAPNTLCCVDGLYILQGVGSACVRAPRWVSSARSTPGKDTCLFIVDAPSSGRPSCVDLPSGISVHLSFDDGRYTLILKVPGEYSNMMPDPQRISLFVGDAEREVRSFGERYRRCKSPATRQTFIEKHGFLFEVDDWFGKTAATVVHTFDDTVYPLKPGATLIEGRVNPELEGKKVGVLLTEGDVTVELDAPWLKEDMIDCPERRARDLSCEVVENGTVLSTCFPTHRLVENFRPRKSTRILRSPHKRVIRAERGRSAPNRQSTAPWVCQGDVSIQSAAS